MLTRGLSVRDIEDAFKDETGRLLLSRTAVSQLGERLWEDYQAFAQRDLGEYEITYLFVDGIAVDCGLGPSVSLFWWPGALRSKAAGCCCT
jgi:transposase-like protein